MKFVTECTEDLASKIRTLVSLEKKTLSVYSMEDLLETMANAVKPAAGILYEGARAVPSEGGKQFGTTGEAVFSILLLTELSAFSKRIDAKSSSHDLLDQIRGTIHGTRSPTGHFWKWQLEAQAKQKANLAVWVQRWTCQVQLPPKSSA